MILSIRDILSAFNFGYTKGNFGYFCNGGSRLQVRGGGGHPDAEIEGRGAVFRHFGPQFSPKLRGRGAGPPGPSPGYATVLDSLNFSPPFRRVEFQFPKVCDSFRHTYNCQTKQSKVYRNLKVRGGN